MSSSASKTGCFKQKLVFNYNSVLSVLKSSEVMHYVFFPQYILSLAAYASIYIYRIVIIILLISQSFYIKFCKSFSPYTILRCLFFPPLLHTIKGSKQATLMLQHKDDSQIPENNQPHTILHTAYLRTSQ